jgi:hypothetical protein
MEDMRLRVKELEFLNQNYLKMVGDLTETVKNLSIELLQKSKNNFEKEKTEEKNSKIGLK